MAQTAEVCTELEIIWRPGYVYGKFLAVGEDLAPIAAIRVPTARSGSVPWPRRYARPDRKRRVVAAVAALDLHLERQGWERFARGEDWYSHRFRCFPSTDRKTARYLTEPVLPAAQPAVATILLHRISAYSAAADPLCEVRLLFDRRRSVPSAD